MNNVRVALLDTGIAKEIIDERVKLNRQIYYDYYDEEIVITDNVQDYNGHGTHCVETMWAINPNIDVYSINMLGVSGVTSSKVFVETLRYAMTLDVDMIAVCSSCVITNKQEELKSLCRQIHDSGKVILAAVENGKNTSHIADHEDVIGVIGGNIDGVKYAFSKDATIQMCCDDRRHAMPGIRGIISDFDGNSHATAVAVGIASKLLYENQNNTDSIIELLEKNKSSSREEQDILLERELNAIEFDEEKENYFVENEIGYHRFIYLLCEFFRCEEPMLIRTTNLLFYGNKHIYFNLDGLIGLIEERFEVTLNYVDMTKFKWAYLFYEKYLYKDNVRENNELGF